MHEAGLGPAVLTALRHHQGPCRRVRLYLYDASAPADRLAEAVRAHLAAADPPIAVPRVEVVMRARDRICSRCVGTWRSAQQLPTCPNCGGAALPARHDHRAEVSIE